MMIDIKKVSFGELPTGEQVDLFTLKQEQLEVSFCTYGGIITAIKTPDKQGDLADVVLGFDTLEDYVSKNPYFGCLVGRFANRIDKGQFELAGKSYQLAQNDGPNHLHGGEKGFDKVVWQAQTVESGVKLSYQSYDGEENYPANLVVEVTYSLEANALRIDYEARSDAATIINLTNHSYFNLAGSGSILEHELMLNADQFNPINETFIPTGDLQDVTDTPFDFRKATVIGKRIAEQDQQLLFAGGYDHNWVLKQNAEGLSLAACVREAVSKRQLEVFTSHPGVQFYSSNMLPDLIGKKGQAYQKHSGLCLETQHFPDSPNQAQFPSVILQANELYKHSTLFKFSVFE